MYVIKNCLGGSFIEHIYIVTYLMDGFHGHKRVYANNKGEARKMFKDVMGSRYTMAEIEEVM